MNGRGTTFNWKTITTDLNQKLNRNCTPKVLKNKFDAMKKDWYLWKGLWHRETVKENKETRRFCNKDFSYGMKELYSEIFEGKCATDENIVAPGMDPSTEDIVNLENGEEDEDSIHNETELETQENSFYSDFLRDINITSELPDHTANDTKSHERAQSPSQNTKTQHKTTKTAKTKPIDMKRKRRQSGGSAMLSEKMGVMVNTCTRALELMELDSTSPNKKGCHNGVSYNGEASTRDTSIALAMDIVNRMVAESLLQNASESWCFLIHLLEDGVKRGLFVNMADDVSSMAWLEYMHA
ncbi:hypothetical protein OROMI_006061 [Orobanche minor]